jgi:predicted amidophosphoribosyltransferase
MRRKRRMKMDNTCVCCGAEIPEGRHVCKACEEGFIAQNQETLSKIGDIAAQIGNAMLESVETAIEALKDLFSPFFDAVKDLARRFGELIADDVQPKTIPPRSPVRCIGCRPVTKYRKPQIIRRTGCRHR